MRERTVRLRAEDDGVDQRFLDAYLERGDLVLEGHDLGPATSMVSDDGEYEWFRRVRTEHVGLLLAALGAAADEDVLDVLARLVTPTFSYELEALLRDGDVPCELHVI